MLFRSTTAGNTGAVVMSGNNTYQGGTTLSAGTLYIGVNTVYSSGITSSAIGTGTLTLGSATISSNANTTGGDRTLYNAVAFSSSPTTTIFGDGTYTGILNFQTGSFALGTSAARTFTINTTTNIANTITGSSSRSEEHTSELQSH